MPRAHLESSLSNSHSPKNAIAAADEVLDSAMQSERQLLYPTTLTSTRCSENRGTAASTLGQSTFGSTSPTFFSYPTAVI